MRARKSAVLLCVPILLLSVSALVMGGDYNEEEPLQELVLRVGSQDDMKTRNILAANDKWTMDVLLPVYGGVGQEDPDTEEPIPYLLKGVDTDDSGTFDLDEYGIYSKEAGTSQLDVIAYYDFNEVYSHDGVQMTMDDLLFSYHLRALNPLTTGLDSIKDKNNLLGTNYSTSRWLHVYAIADSWDSEIPVGPDDTLTFALRFTQQATYADFARYTLNDAMIIPRHVWEGVGKVCLDATAGICTDWRQNIHSNFGYAYDPITRNGIPAANLSAFKYDDAETWLMSDDEVIGTGPFEFANWNPGVASRTDRYEDYKADNLDCVKSGSPPICSGNFFKYMHRPYIDVMLFKIYKTAQAAVFALQAGEIDIVSWPVPPEFIPGLLADPNVGIESNAERGFHYLGYNMRMSPFGYPNNDPALGDDGLYLRKAIAHVIDKKTIVTVLLQNFGVAGDQPVNPAWPQWYNASATKYDFNLSTAMQILDDHYTVGGFGLGYGLSGYRNLPTIGDRQIDILCPQADYDPIRASACNMIAANMRSVGINANAKLLAFGEITERLANHDMEMWILGWRISSHPPEYYFDFFCSRNSPRGLNYPGFQNATADALIGNARGELDPALQKEFLKEATAVLTDALPYDVLYFRTNVEAYRQDRFVNWTVGQAGSIFGESFWSWIGIHRPFGVDIDVLFPYGSTVNENENLIFEIYVTDTEGNPLDGANVTTIFPSPPGPTISPDSGVTMDGSIGNITFTAPEVSSNTAFLITAVGDYMGYWANGSAWVTVLNIDLIPPEISDVSAEPDPQLIDGAVNISASVYDEFLAFVTCRILDPSLNELENWTMEYDSVSSRHYRNRTYDIPGTYQFTIWAYDFSLNQDSSSGTFRIMGPPPAITDVDWKRTTESIPTYVNISAAIESPTGVDSAWVRFWDPYGQQVGNFSMHYSSSADRYWKIVRADVAGEFLFHVSANDDLDRWIGYDSTFLIVDDIYPTADAGSDQVIQQGDTVQFNGTGSSDNWMIANYSWTFFDGKDIVVLYGPEPQSTFTVGGGFLVILEVRDPAGNTDQDYLLVQVIVTDDDGDSLSDWDEENTYGTDPSKEDTDGDGMNDGAEVALGRDPLTFDREKKPFAEEYWWAYLLPAIVLAVALILIVLIGLMRKKREDEDEEEKLQ